MVLYNLRTRRIAEVHEDPGGGVIASALGGEGARLVAAARADGSVYVRCLGKGQGHAAGQRLAPPAASALERTTALSFCGRPGRASARLAAGTCGGVLRIYDAAADRIDSGVVVMRRDGASVAACAWAPGVSGGDDVVLAGVADGLRLVDPRRGPGASFKVASFGGSPVTSLDVVGHACGVGLADGSVHLVDLRADGGLVGSLAAALPGPVASVTFRATAVQRTDASTGLAAAAPSSSRASPAPLASPVPPRSPSPSARARSSLPGTPPRSPALTTTATPERQSLGTLSSPVPRSSPRPPPPVFPAPVISGPDETAIRAIMREELGRALAGVADRIDSLAEEVRAVGRHLGAALLRAEEEQRGALEAFARRHEATLEAAIGPFGVASRGPV